MAVQTFNVGHVDTMSIVYLDALGLPMLTPVTPDSVPVWAQSTPATDALAVAASGLSATATGLAAGTDTISLTVIVGGVSFSATQDLTVDAAPQVLTSVAIANSIV